MAYLPNQNQDQEQDQQGGVGQQGQPAQSVQQLSTGSGANLGSGQSANLGSGRNIQQSQPDSPTGFVNINRYLDENKQQGQQMADSVTSNVLDTANTAASTIRDTGEVFNKNVESQRVNYDPSKYVNNTQPTDDDIIWRLNEIKSRHSGTNQAAPQGGTNQATPQGGTNQAAPQVSDDDIIWRLNEIKSRHTTTPQAAAENEIYNYAKQYGVSADRLEQFLPGTQNWLQQQGKTLNVPAPVSTLAAENEIYSTAKQYGVSADRLEQFLPGTQNWLQQQGKTLNDPTKLTNNAQVSDDDIIWRLNEVTARHGGMTDAAANEIYNLAKQHGITGVRLERFLPGTQNWLQQQGKTLDGQTDALSLFLQAQQITNDPTRLQEFLSQRDAQYTGFGSIEEDYDSFNTMRNSLDNVQNETNMLRSDGGRGTLAARLNPENSTTAGMSSLDNMLFADERNQDKIYNTLNQVENMDLQGIYDNVVTDSKSIVDQVREANIATRESTGQLLGNTIDIYGNAVDQNVTDALSNARGIMGGIQEKLRTNQQLTQDEVNRLGITMDEYEKVSGAAGVNTFLANAATNTANKYSNLGSGYELTTGFADAILNSNFDPNIVSAFDYVDPSLYINQTNAADSELYARQQALLNLSNNGEGFNLIGDPTQTGSYMDQVRGTYDTASALDRTEETRNRIESLSQALLNAKSADEFGRIQRQLVETTKDVGKDMVKEFIKDTEDKIKDVTGINAAKSIAEEIKGVFKKLNPF